MSGGTVRSDFGLTGPSEEAEGARAGAGRMGSGPVGRSGETEARTGWSGQGGEGAGFWDRVGGGAVGFADGLPSVTRSRCSSSQRVCDRVRTMPAPGKGSVNVCWGCHLLSLGPARLIMLPELAGARSCPVGTPRRSVGSGGRPP